MIRQLILGIFLLSLLSGYAPAPKRFLIDTDSSSASWRWHSGKDQHSGMVFISSGELLSDQENITGGAIQVDMNSLSVSTIRDLQQNALLTRWLKGREFFDTYNHPVAVLRIASVWHEDGNRYTLNGSLTIKDKTIPVRVPASVNFEKKRIEITAQLIMHQTKPVTDANVGSEAFKLNLHLVAKR